MCTVHVGLTDYQPAVIESIIHNFYDCRNHSFLGDYDKINEFKNASFGSAAAYNMQTKE